MEKSKKFRKWLISVAISYAIIVSLIVSFKGILGIHVYASTSEAFDFSNETTQQSVIECDEMWKQNIQYYLDMTPSEANFLLEYSTGYMGYMINLTSLLNHADICTVSLVMGLLVGTAFYLFLCNNRRALIGIIITYIFSIFILGFVDGVQSIYGENLLLLDYWIFPKNYILPDTVAFALILIIIYIKQKRTARELNEKLQNIKKY